MTCVLITGANGFIARHLAKALLREPQFQIKGAVRCSRNSVVSGIDVVKVGDLNSSANWGNAVKNVGVIVHTAARVHVIDEKSEDPLTQFRKTNVEGTLNLARQASKAGVRRFIFLSTIGVHGAETFDIAFNEHSKPNPVSAYALSKWEAEEELRELSASSGMEVVIIRPPLVYGQDAPGNYSRLLRLLSSGIPLPLGGIHNERSFVAIDNLIDLIKTCITHPAAANREFLVSDDEDMSTTNFARRILNAMGKKTLLFPLPLSFVKWLGSVSGRTELVRSLFGSLQIDMNTTKTLLSWNPPVSVDEAIKKSVSP
ncbi:MAG: NAD-dependent epimerase/dehydratase family protein [Gammaproteobacteria bacterium]